MISENVIINYFKELGKDNVNSVEIHSYIYMHVHSIVYINRANTSLCTISIKFHKVL